MRGIFSVFTQYRYQVVYFSFWNISEWVGMPCKVLDFAWKFFLKYSGIFQKLPRLERPIFAVQMRLSEPWNYNGFSGKKSRGEHSNNFASSFKWVGLYFARKLGLSMWPIKPVETSKCTAISACESFLTILPSFTLLIMYQSTLFF